MRTALIIDLDCVVRRGRDASPHAVQALAAMHAMHAGSERLALSLVDDAATVTMGDVTAQLTALGIARLVEPIASHVILTSELGARLPEPAVFRAALARLGRPVELAAAMFVTADAARCTAARRLGLIAWQLGSELADWSVVPLLVAHAIGEVDPVRLCAAYTLRVQVVYAQQLASVDRVDAGARQVFATLAGDPAAEVVLDLDPSGDVVGLDHLEETVRERKFRTALDDHGAVAPAGSTLGSGQTHSRGPDGKPRRNRFSLK